MPEVSILNTESFAKLRKGKKYYYVDKTAFLEKFLRAPADATLFTRPRRFGKTLFMSMLAEFFDITKKNREFFDGLAVSANRELCDQWMNQYPVIFLTLKDIDKPTFERALARIHVPIRTFCSQHKYLLTSNKVSDEDKDSIRQYLDTKTDEDTLELALQVLTRALACYYDKPAIVLIDEYDAPVAKAADNGYYDEMIDFMRGFLSAGLKTNLDNLMFGILTGCLRITRESIFSGLNNLSCHDISDYEYADSFGFTQDEVDSILKDAGLSDRKEELKTWYDGYCFGEDQGIYCPWSILMRVNDLQKNPRTPPKSYWNKTSENALLKRLFPGKDLEMADGIATLVSGGLLVTQVNLTPTYESLDSSPKNLWSLLYLSGYLTRASEEQTQEFGVSPDPEEDEMALVIPNREIHKIFLDDVKSWFDGTVSKKEKNDLLAAFWEPDATRFQNELEAILLKNVSCRDLARDPASASSSAVPSEDSPRENFYHGLLVGYFLVAYPRTLSNMEVGKGFYDIRVVDNTGKRAAIVELKRATGENEDLAALAAKGLTQIRERKYDARLLADPSVTTVLHWSIAFFKKSCEARAVIVRQP